MIIPIYDTDPQFIIVDLFCGAGGTTTGFAMTNGIAKVIACVNHDPIAIKSHWMNHPEVAHFEEDIRTLHLSGLNHIVRHFRRKYPNAKLILWASLECTNFSKAKGGQPRDADSRTLADHLDRYILALKPDFVQIENVVEFMSWGPLDEKGKPISRKNGRDWMAWRNRICRYGYHDEWRQMNSADFGAYTSRNRLFGCFAKKGLPIVWPEPTHSKKVQNDSGLFQSFLKKWKPVKDVLDLEDEGLSIFSRKKQLVDASLERIYAGLIKFVAGGKEAFILKYNSSNGKGRHNPPGIDEPCPTIACQNRLGVVNTQFIAKYYSGKPNGKVISVDGPAGTIKTADGQCLINCVPFIVQRNSGDPDSKIISIDSPARTLTQTGGNQELVQPFILNTNFNNVGSSVDEPAKTLLASRHHPYVVNARFIVNYNHSSITNDIEKPAPTLVCKDKLDIINPAFLTKYHGNDKGAESINKPASTLSTKDRLAKVQPIFFDKTYSGNGNSNQCQSIESPAGTIVGNDKHRLISCILNPAYGGHTMTTEAPCPVIVARQDKSPLYLIQYQINENVRIPVYDGDSEVMIRIKKFMALYGISDIKMRMLKVPELLKIQGFPENYHLAGNQTDQKKFIGNSVQPDVVKAWTLAMSQQNISLLKQIKTKQL